MKTKTWKKQNLYHQIRIALSAFFVLILLFSTSAHAAPSLSEYDLPTPGSQPISITQGPDGNMWFVNTATNSVGRITPSGAITEFPVPTPNSSLQDITLGPDGNLWFTESVGNAIGRITPSGTISEFAVPTAASLPTGITAGPDGNLWFTELLGDRIGKITPSGSITEFPLPNSGSAPRLITTGPDGNLWFTNALSDSVGRITPTGSIIEFPILTGGSQPYGITNGSDGNLWFTEFSVGKIGRITPSGTVTEFNLAPLGGVYDIASGPDGKLWFLKIESSDSKVVQMDTNGAVMQEFVIPTTSPLPTGISKGPNNTVWFTETLGNKIGVISDISGDDSGEPNFSSGNGNSTSTLIPGAPDTGVGESAQATSKQFLLGGILCLFGTLLIGRGIQHKRSL